MYQDIKHSLVFYFECLELDLLCHMDEDIFLQIKAEHLNNQFLSAFFLNSKLLSQIVGTWHSRCTDLRMSFMKLMSSILELSSRLKFGKVNFATEALSGFLNIFSPFKPINMWCAGDGILKQCECSITSFVSVGLNKHTAARVCVLCLCVCELAWMLVVLYQIQFIVCVRWCTTSQLWYYVLSWFATSGLTTLWAFTMSKSSSSILII